MPNIKLCEWVYIYGEDNDGCWTFDQVQKCDELYQWADDSGEVHQRPLAYVYVSFGSKGVSLIIVGELMLPRKAINGFKISLFRSFA